MTSVLTHPSIKAALERSGMFPPAPDVVELLNSACEHPEVTPDGILEISRADWGTEEQSADDVLVVQTKAGIFMIVKVKRGRLRPSETARIRCLYEWYQDLVDDDEIAGPSVVFLANPGHHNFLLSFPNTHERNRMFPCFFEAHRGLFSRWGLQLDPAHFPMDFDRYYAEIVSSGPDQPDRLDGWIANTYGEFDRTNALGLAQAWRYAELTDLADTARSSRVSMIGGGDIWWRAETHPSSRRVVVGLCEQLYDAGLLGPPYDEHTFVNDPLSSHDAGPQRLLALMTLAAFAHALRDPRASEWVDAARSGIPVVPPAVFPDAVRELWAGIQDLPAVNAGPPPEIPIWEDADVREITTPDNERSSVAYSVDMLSPTDRALVTPFIEAVGSLQQQESPDGGAVISACLAGVSAFEDLSPFAPTGWRKFIAYVVSDLTCDLWEKYRKADSAAKLAHWVIATVEANGWGPDGRSTALGQHHSHAMGVAAETGVGIIEFDPERGEARAPTGDAARAAAIVGHF